MRDAKRSSSTAAWAASPHEVAEMLGELAGLDARSGARLAAVLRASGTSQITRCSAKSLASAARKDHAYVSSTISMLSGTLGGRCSGRRPGRPPARLRRDNGAMASLRHAVRPASVARGGRGGVGAGRAR